MKPGAIEAILEQQQQQADKYILFIIIMYAAKFNANVISPIRNSHIWHIYASYMNIYGKCMSYMLSYMSRICKHI